MAALIFPIDQNITPGFVRFTPCDQKENLLPGGQAVQLYLPSGVAFGDTAEYENWEAGAAGAAFMDNGMSGLGGATSKTFTNLMDENSGLGEAVVAEIVKKAGTRAGAARNRSAPNPNTRSLFKQVGLRTFQFQFKLQPVSDEEARAVKRIVKSFRVNLYPSLIGGVGGGASLGYNFPNMYKIQMFHEPSAGRGMELEPKIKACFLQSMSTTFNAGSQAILAENGGTPNWSETDITMTFGEGETLTRNDIIRGY
jgi:hypothetical protein